MAVEPQQNQGFFNVVLLKPNPLGQDCFKKKFKHVKEDWVHSTVLAILKPFSQTTVIKDFFKDSFSNRITQAL